MKKIKIMKKFYVLIFCFFISHLIHAQLSVGITAGLHFSAESFSGDPTLIIYDDVQSFQIGIALKTELSDKFKIKGNVLYNIAGSKTNLFTPSGDPINVFKQNLQLEARASLRVLRAIYLEFGPFISYLVAVDQGINRDAFERLGVGVIPAVSFSLGSTLELTAYYQLGLSNLSSTEFTNAAGQVIDGDVNAYQYGLRLSFYLN